MAKSLARSSSIAFSNLKRSDTPSLGPTTMTMPFAISPVPWVPHLGQKRAVKFLLENACAGVFADPGVGKTSATLAAFKILLKKGMARKMLVVAPLRPATLVWPPEILKWLDFNHLRVAVLHGKDKDKILEKGAFDIGVVNYEGLAWLFGAKVHISDDGKKKSVTINAHKFQKYGFDILVCDELSRVKHIKSITFKILKAALQFFSRRWGLTGSPAANGLIDLFGQCYILDMGRSFGKYITHYRAAYFNPSHDGFGWKIREGAEKEIYQRIKPLVLRLAAEDYVDMPEKIERKILFDLPKDVMKIYQEVEDDLFAKIDAGLVVATNAAAASSKCRQIANGGVYLEDEADAPDSKRRWQNLHNLKVDIIEELVNELQGKPILVAYDFLHDLDRLLLRFGKDTPFIGGGVSPKRALELEALWNAGDLPILLGHPQSIGHGLNLQGSGNQVAWHSPNWNLELDEQFVGRVHRQGQKAKHVFVHRVMARDTIDEAIWWALQHKDKTQQSLFDALKLHRRR